eukprot:Gb_21031 [translate_table: standard]
MRSQVSIDIRGVDYPSQKRRFEVVHNSPSTRYNPHIRVQTSVEEITRISLIVSPSPSVGRWEREVWDTSGVHLINHPDLRRVLTDYGFEGHPSRKDFPLSGYVEVRYDDPEKSTNQIMKNRSRERNGRIDGCGGKKWHLEVSLTPHLGFGITQLALFQRNNFVRIGELLQFPLNSSDSPVESRFRGGRSIIDYGRRDKLRVGPQQPAFILPIGVVVLSNSNYGICLARMPPPTDHRFNPIPSIEWGESWLVPHLSQVMHLQPGRSIEGRRTIGPEQQALRLRSTIFSAPLVARA